MWTPAPKASNWTASVFAIAPYELSAAWPDLTLWRDGKVRFVEVKSACDQLHAS